MRTEEKEMYYETYIQGLKRRAAERRTQQATEAANANFDPRAGLKNVIAQWYAALPPDARAPHYFMEQLTRHLRMPAQQLGIALRELGWRCERVWCKGQPYRHYWVPPQG